MSSGCWSLFLLHPCRHVGVRIFQMKWLVSLLFLAIASGDRFGVCASEPSSIFSNQELRVAVIYSPPFSMEKSPAVYTGFSVELWEKLAATLKLNYVYVPCSTMPELIQKLESGQLDVAVTNMVVTSSRLKLIDFTQPYFNGGLRIMVNSDRRFNFARFYAALDKYGYIEIFLVFTGILLVLTYVVTLFQRRLTQDFPQRWHEGLADSFYHVMSVAMNGKINYAAKTGALGKVLAGIWLMCGVAVVAYITSSVTSIMTLNKLKNEINGAQDLNGKLVGVMKGTAAEEFCQVHQMYVKAYTDPKVAVSDLINHQIQAIVGEAASLQYYDKMHPELPITEVGSVFSDEKYAFGLPKDSGLRTELNIGLLMLQENGFLHDLQLRYFGDP